MNYLPYHPLPKLLLKVLPVFVVLSTLVCIIVGFRYAGTRLSDFAGYYTAGRMFIEGRESGDLYDDAKFQEAMQSYGIHEPTIVMYVNPPTVSIPVVVVSWLPPFQAKFLWNLLSIVCMVASWHILVKALHVPDDSGYRMLLMFTLVGTVPFLRNLQLGQMYAFMVLLFSILLNSYLSRKVLVVALSFAGIVLLKFYGWIFLVMFAMQRRWREFWWSIAATAIGGGVCVLYFGGETYAVVFGKILSLSGSVDTASFALRSVAAPLSKLFVFNPQLNPHAISNIPTIPAIVPWVLLAGAVWLARETRENDSTCFSAFLVLSVIFTPLAADHHYILLAMPAFVLLASGPWREGQKWKRVIIGVCIFLLFGWLPQLPDQYLEGVWVVLAYWRLYAAVVLFLLLVRFSLRPPPFAV